MAAEPDENDEKLDERVGDEEIDEDDLDFEDEDEDEEDEDDDEDFFEDEEEEDELQCHRLNKLGGKNAHLNLNMA